MLSLRQVKGSTCRQVVHRILFFVLSINTLLPFPLTPSSIAMPEYWFVSVPGEGNRTVTFQNFKAKIASSQNDLAEVAPLPIPEFKVPSLATFLSRRVSFFSVKRIRISF